MACMGDIRTVEMDWICDLYGRYKNCRDGLDMWHVWAIQEMFKFAGYVASMDDTRNVEMGWICVMYGRYKNC
jgi:hypothetical protein